MNSMAHPDGDQGAGSDDAATTPGPRSIGKDDVFHLLQNGRRRAVLRYIIANPAEQYDMRTIAEEVAAWEHDTTVAELTSNERQRVYIALYQSHLPKLADEGAIRYDQDRGVVEPTSLLSVLEPYLGDGLAENDELSVSVEDTSTDGSGLAAALSAVFFAR